MPSIASGYEYPPPPTLVTRSETGYTEEIEDFQEMYSNVIPGPHSHDVLFRIGTGDLTRQHVGAIVNAANNQLHHAGGLAAMISQKGGPMIQEESNSYIQTYGQVETGQVAATRAGQLPCQYVIHAVGPRYNPTNIPRSQQLLTEAVHNAILYASSVPPDTMPQRTMAIPLISAGIFQYPRKDAAMVIVSAIERCIQENPIKLEEVRFVLDSHLTAHQAIRSLTVTEPPAPLLQQMSLVPVLPPPPPAPESVISEFEEDDVKPTPDRPKYTPFSPSQIDTLCNQLPDPETSPMAFYRQMAANREIYSTPRRDLLHLLHVKAGEGYFPIIEGGIIYNVNLDGGTYESGVDFCNALKVWAQDRLADQATSLTDVTQDKGETAEKFYGRLMIPQDAAWFTVIDLANAFFSIALHPDCQFCLYSLIRDDN
ncbi:unnamed protein product [Ranitomeya imitator]|uniref:Macro domain-containing protein n=1 Tax=Ranitomeya imitator TaxID=111125 RepID=A0ABN9L342_9NEOB|nr:unnamed protein product [Ranitomeya imitator]